MPSGQPQNTTSPERTLTVPEELYAIFSLSFTKYVGSRRTNIKYLCLPPQFFFIEHIDQSRNHLWGDEIEWFLIPQGGKVQDRPRKFLTGGFPKHMGANDFFFLYYPSWKRYKSLNIVEKGGLGSVISGA